TRFDPYLLFERDGLKVYEQIDSRALDNADMSDVIMQYDHSGKVMARQSNNSLIVEPDSKGIFMAADLSLTESSRQLYDEITKGLVTKMSWAFTINDQEFEKESRTRIIRSVKK